MSTKAIEKYIEEYYPDRESLGETRQKRPYNGTHGHMVRIKGTLWYLRFWSPEKPGDTSKVEYTRGNLVYKPNGEFFS